MKDKFEKIRKSQKPTLILQRLFLIFGTIIVTMTLGYILLINYQLYIFSSSIKPDFISERFTTSPSQISDKLIKQRSLIKTGTQDRYIKEQLLAEKVSSSKYLHKIILEFFSQYYIDSIKLDSDLYLDNETNQLFILNIKSKEFQNLLDILSEELIESYIGKNDLDRQQVVMNVTYLYKDSKEQVKTSILEDFDSLIQEAENKIYVAEQKEITSTHEIETLRTKYTSLINSKAKVDKDFPNQTVLGYYIEGSTIKIIIDPDNPINFDSILNTLIHEKLHHLSSHEDKEFNPFFDEGITQYFTQEITKYFVSSSNETYLIPTHFVRVMNSYPKFNPVLLSAYLNKDESELTNIIDSSFEPLFYENNKVLFMDLLYLEEREALDEDLIEANQILKQYELNPL